MIAATNRDLRKLVDDGKFREDLWFRLNVIRILVPPLRERRGDVPLLAQHFLKKYDDRYGRQTRLTNSGLKAMTGYTWPGNVRQLQHLMERLSILAPMAGLTTPPSARPSKPAKRASMPPKPSPTPRSNRSGVC